MPERSRPPLGPYYAIRLTNLERHHILTATCMMCRHKRTMRLWELRALVPASASLEDINRRLRCRRCGRRGEARVLVTVVGDEADE